jgi:HKD family nuclease
MRICSFCGTKKVTCSKQYLQKGSTIKINLDFDTPCSNSILLQKDANACTDQEMKGWSK